MEHVFENHMLFEEIKSEAKPEAKPEAKSEAKLETEEKRNGVSTKG